MSERITKDRFRCKVGHVRRRGGIDPAVSLYVLAMKKHLLFDVTEAIYGLLEPICGDDVRVTMQNGVILDVELDDGKEFG